MKKFLKTTVLCSVIFISAVMSLSAQSREKTFNLWISAGNRIFTAKLYDTDTNARLVQPVPNYLWQIPYSYDAGGVMKYYDLPSYYSYPLHPEKISGAKAGEIFLDDSNRLYLFYKDADFSGEYTRIGYIEDTRNLERAVGTGRIYFLLSRRNPQQ